MLDRVAERAQSAGESHLVLVTGVPGAGKTLVGLQFVYESHFGESSDKQRAVFLSGNGPLVKVLQHTLKSRVFVQDVLGFLKTYGGSRGALPREHVWVFDEAQRAFDAEMAMEKRGEPISEPEDFLRLGEKLDSWALMVGLIGEGQEINRGEEAGIAQWNDALATMDKPWHVHCPPSLAPIFTNAAETTIEKRLSLDVTLRSHRAEEIHKWVALLLAGDLDGANRWLSDCSLRDSSSTSRAILRPRRPTHGSGIRVRPMHATAFSRPPRREIWRATASQTSISSRRTCASDRGSPTRRNQRTRAAHSGTQRRSSNVRDSSSTCHHSAGAMTSGGRMAAGTAAPSTT